MENCKTGNKAWLDWVTVQGIIADGTAYAYENKVKDCVYKWMTKAGKGLEVLVRSMYDGAGALIRIGDTSKAGIGGINCVMLSVKVYEGDVPQYHIAVLKGWDLAKRYVGEFCWGDTRLYNMTGRNREAEIILEDGKFTAFYFGCGKEHRCLLPLGGVAKSANGGITGVCPFDNIYYKYLEHTMDECF